MNLSRALFVPSDDPLLNVLDDDGLSIEPEYYVPILPLVLVNRAEGIGTGYSTSIPNYNPRDIIDWIRLRIESRQDEAPPLVPWYRDFIGDIRPTLDTKVYTYTQ